MSHRALLSILIPLGVIAMASATVAQSTVHPDLAPSIAALRAGKWSGERLAFVVEQLVVNEDTMWAGPWLAEADAAKARGDLELPAKLRKELAKEVAEGIPEETSSLLRESLRIIDSLIRAKRGAEAREQIAHVRGCLALWPDGTVSKRLERLEKKVAKLKTKPRGPVEERLATKLDALRTRLERAAVVWLDDAAAGFEAYGSASAFRGLAALATGELASRYDDLRIGAKKAGLQDSLTVPATLLVLGYRDTEVWLDGEKIGSQPSETDVRIATEEHPAPTHRFAFRVWPRSRLALVQPGGDTEAQFHGAAAKIGDATCLQLVVGGKTVPTNWRSSPARSFDALAGAGFSRVYRGKIKPIEGDLAAEDYSERATHQVEYDLPGLGVVVPHPSALAAYFERHKGRGAWITGGRLFGSFVFDFPSDLTTR